MAPATRKKVVSCSTGRANSTERGTVADRLEAAGIKRKRDPRESDTRRPQNQHAPATDPKDSGRLATQASRNRTTTYHQGNRETFSRYWPPPSDIIDLTNDDDDDAVEGNCKRSKETIQHRRITPSIKPELLNTGDTDIIATTSIKDIRPVSHDEPVGDNGIEQETSSMGPDIHSASVAAVIGVTCDHLQASNKKSAPEPGPTAILGIQQGPAETNTPEQLVEGLLKSDLEKAKINVEKSKMRLKWLEEELEREKKNLTANQTVVQYFTNLINGSKAGAGFIKAPKKKYTRHHTKTDNKRYSSILCDDKTCSIGREECQNRWLETWARKEGELSQHLEIRENPRFGKELIWNGPVGKDPERLIAEYRGQLISTNELMARREKQDGGSIMEGHFNFEVKSLGGPEHLWLDSTYKGSIARFANHNCDPNCIVIQFLDSNGPRLFLQSARRINPGDAITINYGLGVPPAYFRVTIGLKSQDVPVCYCGRDGCQWKITSAVRDMEIWLNKVPGDWSKDRKPGEPVPRTMNLYLPGARHAINVFEGDCDPDNEEEILRIACGNVISHLQASLVKIIGGNGS
ncbi:SET domain-containing protein [Fusarium globosum]|uniref:SET domain-containing protein n=1 Tax=Fusarium globosum TaxID=78864 RepID=A0A8H6D4I9_9HYPO|nr:SET domain-containing protein [Fusarium globosum]